MAEGSRGPPPGEGALGQRGPLPAEGLGGGNAGDLVIEPTWNREGPEQAAYLALQPGDVVLLCSDGLCGEAPAEDLDRLAGTHGQNPQALVKECIQAALDAGGHDNVTVVALRWGENAEPGSSNQPETGEEEAEREDETGVRAGPQPARWGRASPGRDACPHVREGRGCLRPRRKAPRPGSETKVRGMARPEGP